jgi:PAS domain S-box-containing protein
MTEKKNKPTAAQKESTRPGKGPAGQLHADDTDLTNFLVALDIATVFVDADMNIRSFTPPVQRLVNLLESDVGRSLKDVAQKLNDDALLEDCEAASRKQTVAEAEVVTNDGRHLLRRIHSYDSAGARSGGVAITFYDITDRFKAETRIRHMAAVLRDSNDAVIISTLDGRITGWNHGAETAYGYSKAEACRLDLRQILPDKHKHTVAEVSKQVLAGEDIAPYESQRITRDGRVLDVEVTVTPLGDEFAAMMEIARTERDITSRLQKDEEIRKLNADLERRIAERTGELAASGHRIRAILDATADAIFTIDRNERIENFNKAAEAMFGYSEDEAKASRFANLLVEPYRSDDEERRKLYQPPPEQQHKARLRELKARRKNGTEFPAQISVSPIANLGLHTFLVRDISAQRALQEEIVRTAAAEQRRIGEELHDNVQQQLTGLGLLAEHLAESSPELGSKDIQNLASRLAKGIAECNQDVRQLANGLIPVAIDAEGLMVALSELASRIERETGIRCEFSCPAPVNIADDFTALHLYRVAQEATHNAVRHAAASTITIRLERIDDTISIKIRDDGIGISEDDRLGGGLGLRLMEHRCGIIGGTFTIVATPQGGTEIICRIPHIERERE